MRIFEFKRLPVIEKEEEMDKLNVGDNFLYGKRVISQKETKKEGSSITYYQIIEKKENSIEYVPIFDYMEKNKGEGI